MREWNSKKAFSGSVEQAGPIRKTSHDVIPKKKRKVLVVYPYFATYRKAVIEELLKSEVFDYTFAADTSAKAPALKVLQEEDLPNGFFTRLRNLWLMNRFLWQRGVCSMLWRGKFDAVIFFGDAQYLSSWIAAVIARVRGKTVVMWTHGILRSEPGPRGFIRRLFYRLGHGLMVYGNRARDLLIEGGRDPLEIAVIFNSLDYNLQRRLRKAALSQDVIRRELEISCEAIVLIWVGRIVAGRNLDLLFEAAVLLAPRRPVRILLIGEGPARRQFQDMADALGIGNLVCWLGAVHEEEELAKLFRASDVCVCPSPVGLLAMHAMAYGIPVITNSDFNTQKPEFEAIVPGETGAFFSAGDATDLVRKIEELFYLIKRGDRNQVERQCIDAVERSYTPIRQKELIEGALTKWQRK